MAELVRARGVVLKRQGRDLLGRCPFHDDKTPSLVVSPRKNLWHCLGACNVGGSVIDWVMRVEGLEFRAAVDWLRERFGDFGGSRGDLEVGAVGEVAELDVDERRLLNQVMDYYHERLKESPEALEYLRRRGLIHRELLGAFRVGFADRTLGLRIPGKACKEGREIRERLARIGLFRADSGREHFAGSLVFPIMEENGVVVGAYGRRIGDKLRAGTSPHLYLPGPHRGIFNTRALVSREIILCESIIDALSFWVHDFRHVTASYGANGFTDEMLRAFVASGVRVVFIAYDADAAGERAAAALGRKLASADISCRRVEFPAGMDANEFVLRSGENARAELGRLLECAVPMDCGKGAAGLFFPLAASDAPVGVDVAAKEENRVATPCASPSVSCSEEVRSQEKEDAAKEGNRGGSPCGRAQIKGEDVELCCEDRVYRVRGLAKNLSCDTLRITLRVAREQRIHIDTLDMYNARQRAPFIQAAAAELGVKPEAIRCDLAELLLELEKIQERQIANTLNPAKKEVTLSEQERCMALEFLKSPDLVERIRADFARCGLVGEQDNALLLYLAMTSRKLSDPLAVVIQSLSAAGKTALMNFGLAFMPPEDVIKYTAMSAQSLFYMGQNDLVHKILSISEEEGAEKATYPLKIMQSEGELCMASTGKDPKNGRFVTHEYRVDGPSSIIVATTSADMDEEFANRCLLISADEQREQTESIQARQRERETLPGLVQNVERERIRKLHQNAQRLLRPVSVVNPYAKHLTFLANRVRYRRDQPKYLCLIRAIALLHQYQRPLNKRVLENGDVLEYIHVTLDDIALANRLFAHVMGVCLSELPPQTYKLLVLIYGMVQKRCNAENIEQSECRFTRREVREFTGWGDTQTKIHMQRLADLEYLHLRHGANGQRNVYQLAYNGEGKDGSRFALGLLDVEVLREKLNYDSNRSGQNSNRSG